MSNPTFQPRPYQTATKAAIQAFWGTGKTRPLVIAPTGAGKTEISKMILEDFASPMAIVHTRTLFEQTARRIPEVRVYTLQGLLAPGHKGDQRRAALARHDVVFIDEAHHVGGAEWQRVLTLEHLPERCFGVTATPMRSDGTPLGDFFDCFHVAAKYSELVKAGHLVKCDVQRSEISRTDQKKDKVRPDGVAAYLSSCRRDDGSWRPGIHFEVTVEACENASRRYNEAGLRSVVIEGNTDDETRRKTFAAFTAGELDMLCSPTVLAEGFDSPRAEVCVLRRSCDHVGDYLQRVGRVLRPFPGKERALLIDICNTSTKKGNGLPTDDRVYSLEGNGIALAPTIEELEEEAKKPAPAAWTMVESRYVMIRDTLLARYRDFQAMAAEYQYKPGWVWHRFTEATSIEPPRQFEAKYQSTCLHCRKRLKLGELMFWRQKGEVFHEECWFSALDGEKLEAASTALEHAHAWKPSRSRTMRDMIENDEIPF